MLNLNEKGRQFPKGLRVMKEPMGGGDSQSHIHIEEDFSRVHLFGSEEPVQLKAVEVRWGRWVDSVCTDYLPCLKALGHTVGKSWDFPCQCM